MASRDERAVIGVGQLSKRLDSVHKAGLVGCLDSHTTGINSELIFLRLHGRVNLNAKTTFSTLSGIETGILQISDHFGGFLSRTVNSETFRQDELTGLLSVLHRGRHDRRTHGSVTCTEGGG